MVGVSHRDDEPELSQSLKGAYERKAEESTTAMAPYKRKFPSKASGSVSTKVPRDRKGEYQTAVIPRSSSMRMKSGTIFVLCSWVSQYAALFDHRAQRLIGRKLSNTEVSQATKSADAVEKWRNRDLSVSPIKYIFVDGVISICAWATHRDRPRMVAIGVSESGADWSGHADRGIGMPLPGGSTSRISGARS